MNETFQNSKEAYEYVRAAGLLSESIAETFVAICLEFPTNQTMTHLAIVKATGRVGMQKYSVSPRFAVLERMGLIEVTHSAACPVSGRTTAFYAPTLRRPTCTEREALDGAKRRASVEELEDENRELREEVTKLRELLSIRSASQAQSQARAAARMPVPVQMTLLAV